MKMVFPQIPNMRTVSDGSDVLFVAIVAFVSVDDPMCSLDFFTMLDDSICT